MLEYIGSQETLEAWQGKSLDERTVLFNSIFKPVKISSETLRKAYIKLGIKKKKIRQTKSVPEKTRAHQRR